MTANIPSRQRLIRFAAILLVAPLLVTFGCAGMRQTTNQVADEWSTQAKQSVTSTTRLNMAPFAEHLVKLVADIQFGLSGEKPVYTRQYLNGPEAAQLAHDINARLVIPCHFEMFEFNTASPDPFIAEARNLHQAHRVLRAGERWSSHELSPTPTP